jgi:NaMN:DMB phosphoribosyltransferase
MPVTLAGVIESAAAMALVLTPLPRLCCSR